MDRARKLAELATKYYVAVEANVVKVHKDNNITADNPLIYGSKEQVALMRFDHDMFEQVCEEAAKFGYSNRQMHSCILRNQTSTVKRNIWGPTIIDELGMYVTSGGYHVRISEIGDPAKSTFNAKGHWYKPEHVNKLHKHHWDIWHIGGRYTCDASELDIVKKLEVT